MATCLGALLVQKQEFLSRIIKLKWLFLSILMIYAIGTPGEYITNDAFQYLPTKEGIYLGFIQLAKLMIALSSLTILFYKKEISALVYGLNALLSPLKCLNINVSQFSVRLLLTLHYVNTMTQLKSTNIEFADMYRSAIAQPLATELNVVHLKGKSLNLSDYLILLMLIAYFFLLFNPIFN